jgi:thymidylate synthase (FAD)
MSATTLTVTRVWETIASSDEPYLKPALLEWMEVDEGTTPADAIPEFAGRACYESWDKPNPLTRENSDYNAHVLDVGHFSVFGHASVGYYIEGISRTLTHELVRSRFPAFSQLSQRYVRLDDDLPYVVPPLCEDDPVAQGVLMQAATQALTHYDQLVNHLTLTHPQAKPKEIREAARAVLPGMTETKLVVTANVRAWRDLLAQRLPEGADAEIRRLARELLTDLKKVAPASFQDIEAP